MFVLCSFKQSFNLFLQISTVTFSYCIDTENRNIVRQQGNNYQRRENSSQASTDQQQTYSTVAPSFQAYTLNDVPNLAEQAATMYAQNPTEKANYLQYYTAFYTKQVSQVSRCLVHQ